MERRAPGEADAKLAQSKLRSSVRVCGYQRGHCGYCNLDKESISFGVLSKTLLVDDYLCMMHRGWRRSGKYLYKPTNFASCCACYTIRLRVGEFQISKSQKKVLRNFDRFLSKGKEEIAANSDNNSKAAPVSSSSSSSSGARGGDEEKGSNEKAKMTTGSKSNGNGKEKSASGTKEEAKCPDEVKTSAAARLMVETVDAEATDERFELYKKYQIAVHKDKPSEVTKTGFTRFLVESPLVSEERFDEKTGKILSLGCKHQLYRLDGRLIAVGVIDLLPDGLSSVYTFYDPDDRDLVLGKLTALKEIEFTREAGLDFYYMGFYIHDCQKMRYKAEYKPSELLCGTSLEWFPYAACKPLMDQDHEGSGLSVYTPFHPTFLQQRAELGLSNDEKRLLKLKTDLAVKTAAEEEKKKKEMEKEMVLEGSGGEKTPTGKGGSGASEMQQEETKELAADADKMDEDKDGEEEEEDDDDDESISAFLINHSLQALAPQFTNSNLSMIEQIPFSVGSYEGLLLRHLNPAATNARKIIEGYLRDMIQNCGAGFCREINVTFN